MKEIRLCDDTEVKRISKLCIDNNLGIEIQGFYNPKLMNTLECEKLLNGACIDLDNLKSFKISLCSFNNFSHSKVFINLGL